MALTNANHDADFGEIFFSDCSIQVTMKKFLVVLFAAVLSSCSTIAPPAPGGSVDHLVFFWQKRPGNLEDRKKITDAIDRLRVIEGMTALDYGVAVPSSRPVVDDSFDLAMRMRFTSLQALQSYETDPRHVKEVKEVLLPLTKKIQVYDYTP